MIDFDGLIRGAIARIGSNAVAVAMPYERPRHVLGELAARGLIAGSIADDAADVARDPAALGWWERRDPPAMAFAPACSPILAIIGVAYDWRLPAGFIFRSFLAGRRRIVTFDCNGAIIEDVRAPALNMEMWRKVRRPPAAVNPTFVDAIDMVFSEIGEELRVPPAEFEADKLLMLIGSLGPGGAERQASYLASEIARRGAYRVEIVCHDLMPPGDFFLAETRAAGVTVRESREFLTEFDSPGVRRARAAAGDAFGSIGGATLAQIVLDCARVIRASRAAIVHTWMDYFNSLGAIAATLVGAPRLVMSGRSMAPIHFGLFHPSMKPAYRAVLARRPVTMLNNSAAGARDYEAWLGLKEGAIQTIHNGFRVPDLDAAAERLRLRRAFGWADDAPVVGSILRFSEEKRPDFLIDMARAALARDPSIRFAFFGGGPMREPLMERVAALGHGDAIRLPGQTAQPWQELAGFDLFALASRMEGLPNVLVEAQLAGVPVICTGVGGMAETFRAGETGVIAPGDDPSAFAAAALGLLSDRVRLSAMSVAARDFARHSFSIEAMVNRHLDVYAAAGDAVAIHKE